MSQLAFDSYEYVRILTDAGFTERQVEALSKAQRIAVKEALASQEIATKADLASQTAEFNIKLAEQTAELNKRIAQEAVALNKKMDEQMIAINKTIIDQAILSAEKISEMKVSIIQWMATLFIIGLGAFMVALIFGLFMYLPQISGVVKP